MIFASLTFLYFFLPLCIIFYYISGSIRYKNIILILFSLIFYAWGEPVWVILLIFSALVDYVNGLLIEKHRNKIGARIALLCSIIINIGILLGFKYTGFIYENLNFIFGLNLRIPHITLPIGISFYTFQTLSYTIDLYRGKVNVQKSFTNFLLFVSLFPQLVAGPIVRYEQIAYQIEHRKTRWIMIYAGLHRFCIGLFKKVAIANIAGDLSKPYLEASSFTSLTVGEAWIGIILYSLQIYYDFSGYSDMAIGLGKIFGFNFPENFKYPYISISATEFWRRWHISLGSFFRDYVYIPLGGKYKRRYLNLFIVWSLTGLWHGASWNFVLWGLYFGFLIVIEQLFLMKILNYLPKILRHLYLIFIAIIGWTLFYFTEISRLKEYLKVLFSLNLSFTWKLETIYMLKENILWFTIAIILCMPVYMWLKKLKNKLLKQKFQLQFYLILFLIDITLLLVCTSMLIGNFYNPFIYYRF